MRPMQKVETFPDGIVTVYSDNGRRLGDLKIRLRFKEQSVGVHRFYQAQAAVAGSSIDKAIKVPHTDIVDRLDIAVISTEGDRQYRIQRIQRKPEQGADLWELQSVQVAIRS